MKIVVAVHYFLPGHQAGTEVYTANLALALASDHEVYVLTSEDSPTGAVEVRDDTYEGLPVTRLYHPDPRDFEHSYKDPQLDELFGQYLDRIKPDVVHFQHLFRLSTGFVEQAKKRGIPTLLTLADYWFICPPILLLGPGFQLCPGPDQGLRCVSCGNAIGRFYAGDVSRAAKGFETAAEKLVQTAHALKHRLPRSWVEGIRSFRLERDLKNPGSEKNRRAELLQKRYRAMQQALAGIDLVIAPSNFLREKIIDAGIVDPTKIIHSDYGFDGSRFEGLKPGNTDHVRFGFIGTPVEHKGLHVLVEAMNDLQDTQATLDVYGDLSWFPAYARQLNKLNRNPRTRFLGRFENARVGQILSSLDALVVPSLWYENSPLTIHEAFLAGLPVVTSDIGGMAELVQDGVSGLTFKIGEAEDLTRTLRRLVNEPDLLERLARGIPKIKDISENADELTLIYEGLLADPAME